MADFSFLKKLSLPAFSLGFLKGKPARIAGIDIGAYSTKVVQLRYDSERAILETYGELLNEGYFKNPAGSGAGVLRYSDQDIASLLADVLRESNVATKDAVLSVPAASSFVTTISFPKIARKEIEAAIPFEARKYVPIPIAEVALDWDIFEENEERNSVEVLLVAVPKEVIEKYRRVGEAANLNIKALEVESFSMARSLIRQEPIPVGIVNFGAQSTTLAIADQGKVRSTHTVARGGEELTRALERGLGIAKERAESLKREVGLSERIEEKEIASILAPLVETLLSEIERFISQYNRRAPRHVQKLNLTGGGSNLKGLVERAATRFGLEVTRGDPFSRIVFPGFLQPVLRGIGPSFSVAAGLALHQISVR